MRGFVVAARPRYLPGGLLPYALGVVLGRGAARPAAVFAGAAVVVFVHTVTHWVNDADDAETDALTASPTMFTGGSRAIQRGLVTPERLLRGARALSVAVLGIALLEVAVGDPIAAALHLAILGFGYAYSGAPFVLGRRGLGEADTALVMGVLVPLAGAHAGGGVSPVVWAVSALLFAETVVARLGTAWPDWEADRATNKRTLPVLLGRRRCAVAFAGAAALVALAGLLAAPSLPWPGWQRANAIAFASVAAIMAWLVGSGRAERRPIVLPLLGAGAWGASVLGLLVACSLGAGAP